jgi:hypothetical protein
LGWKNQGGLLWGSDLCNLKHEKEPDHTR